MINWMMNLLDEKATGTGAIAKWALMLQHSNIFFTFKHNQINC
jgi:hypothetical protein